MTDSLGGMATERLPRTPCARTPGYKHGEARSDAIVTDGVPHGAAFDGAAFDVPSEKASWEQRVKLLKRSCFVFAERVSSFRGRGEIQNKKSVSPACVGGRWTGDDGTLATKNSIQPSGKERRACAPSIPCVRP